LELGELLSERLERLEPTDDGGEPAESYAYSTPSIVVVLKREVSSSTVGQL